MFSAHIRGMPKMGEREREKGTSRKREGNFSTPSLSIPARHQLHSDTLPLYIMFTSTRTLLRTAVATPTTRYASRTVRPASQILRQRSSSPYSTAPPPPEESTQEPAAATEAPKTNGAGDAASAATTELQAKVDQQSKTIAELKVHSTFTLIS